MDLKERHRLYNEILSENEKLITHVSKKFNVFNTDSSFCNRDFKQEARVLLWECFDKVNYDTKDDVHRLWKRCLYLLGGNIINRQRAKKRASNKKVFLPDEIEPCSSIDIPLNTSEIHNYSVEPDLNDLFDYCHNMVVFELFLEHIGNMFGQKHLRYKILKEIVFPSEEFQEFAKQFTKKDISNIKQHHIAKYFKVTTAMVSSTVKYLRESFSEWMREMRKKNLASVNL